VCVPRSVTGGGALVDDFLIAGGAHAINVLNAPVSCGNRLSLAIRRSTLRDWRQSFGPVLRSAVMAANRMMLMRRLHNRLHRQADSIIAAWTGY